MASRSVPRFPKLIVAVALASSMLGLTIQSGMSAHAASASYPSWMNSHQPPKVRAEELLAAMSQSDKVALITGQGQINPALGIPILASSDGADGVRGPGLGGYKDVTAFPAAENLAASFDTALAHDYGTAVGQELWGKGIGAWVAPTLNIVRTPYWGREGETLSEDPYLTGQIAANEVLGVQGQHVIAMPKHFAGNNQDTDRFGIPFGSDAINDIVSERALQEIYFPGFKAAITQGHAQALMCSANRVNGIHACENSSLLDTVKNDWGFQGYVDPDTLGVRDPVAGFKAGTDTPPITPAQLTSALADGSISLSRLDDAVVRILTAKFATGQFDIPNTGNASADVATQAHRNVATQISEEGSVLLQNRDGILPISSNVKSVAVIGEAGTSPTAAQLEVGASPYVTASHIVTPLDGITARAGSNVTINSAEGSLGDVPLPAIPSSVLTPSSGTGPGLTGTYFPTDNFTGTSATQVDPTVNVVAFGCPAVLNGTCAKGPAIPTWLLLPGGVNVWSARWTGTLNPPTTGDYRFSLLQGGGGRIVIDGKTVVQGQMEDDENVEALPLSPPIDLGSPVPEQGLIHLTAGQPVSIEVDFQANEGSVGLDRVQVGWEPPSQSGPMIQQAVAAAEKSQVAVVFANEVSSEGEDRSNLDLPGDQDELISAVAAANPNTIVVLNTAGPVLMPWLHDVKGVIEAWMPGQQDGQAIAALLFGDVNFSGRLPVTWPASPDQGVGQTPAEFPGVNNNELYSEGIFVGYRYYQEFGQQPLFPFGYGLTYSHFSIGHLQLAHDSDRRWTVSATVENTSTRVGSDVVELYVGDPPSTGEPPEQLKGFIRVTLQPGAKTVVQFELTSQDLSHYNNGGWVVSPGTYTVSVGNSATDLQASTSLTMRH